MRWSVAQAAAACSASRPPTAADTVFEVLAPNLGLRAGTVGHLHNLTAICRRDLTAAAAEDAIARLERAGQLINLHGTVLLRPGEVAEALNLVGCKAEKSAAN